MDKEKKWMYFILSLLLLIQEVRLDQPLPFKRRSLEGEQEENKSLVVHSRKKRWVATAIIVGGMLGSLGFDMAVAIGGCKTIRPSIENAVKDFDKAKANLQNLYTELNSLWIEGNTNLHYLERLSDELQDLFDTIETLDTYAQAVSEQLDGDIATKISDATANYTTYLSSIQATDIDEFGNIQTAYQHAFTDVWSSIWRLRGFISWPLTILLTKLGGYLVNRAAAGAVSANPGFFSQQLTKVSNSRAGIWTTSKYTATKSWVSSLKANTVARIKLGITVAVTVIWLVMEGLAVLNTWNGCKEKENKIEKETKKMTDEYEKLLALKTEMVETNLEISTSYQELVDSVTTDEFNEYLDQIQEIIDGATDMSEDVASASVKVKSFRTFKSKANKQDKEILLIGLDSGLTTLSQTLECVSKKLSFVKMMEQDCLSGARTMTAAYASAVLGTDPNCVSQTYMNETELSAIVAETMAGNGYFADCLLNSIDIQTLICNDNVNRLTVQEISEKHSILNSTNIQTILSTKCSKAELTDIVRSNICYEKVKGSSESEVVPIYKQYSEQDVKDVYGACKIPLNSVQIDIICSQKKQEVPLETIIEKLQGYDKVQIDSEYHACQNIPTTFQTFICVYKSKPKTLEETQQAFATLFSAVDIKAVFDKC